MTHNDPSRFSKNPHLLGHKYNQFKVKHRSELQECAIHLQEIYQLENIYQNGQIENCEVNGHQEVHSEVNIDALIANDTRWNNICDKLKGSPHFLTESQRNNALTRLHSELYHLIKSGKRFTVEELPPPAAPLHGSV